jgi:hypothetical protein
MGRNLKQRLRCGDYVVREIRDFEREALLEAVGVLGYEGDFLREERNRVRRFKTTDDVVPWGAVSLFSIDGYKRRLAFLDALKKVKEDLYLAILEARLLGNHST